MRNHSNPSTVKVSYSSIPNVKSTISSQNHRVLKRNNVATTGITCNCRDKNQCTLEGICLTKSVVYKAEITTKDTYETKNYIGVTAGQFKDRYNNHRKSLNNYAYRKETELSKYAWELKDQGKDFNMKWSVINLFLLTRLVEDHASCALKKNFLS